MPGYGILNRHFQAELMELADMQDLGSCAVRRVGSSPTFRTEN